MNYPYPNQSQTQYQQMGYRPQQIWPAPQQQIPQVRPVSSIEEVRASPIDFDGSIFYFPDIANKKIYTKSINLDGTVGINLYELKENAAANNMSEAGYVTRQEFEDTINQLKLFYDELIQNMSQANDKKVNQPAALQF